MSDSDDTDFLLFIPPNFFTLSSPECMSPVRHLSYFEESFSPGQRDSVYRSMNSFNSFKKMDPESKSASFFNKVSDNLPCASYSGNVEKNDEPLSLNALEFSPDKTMKKLNTCNTWPTKAAELNNLPREGFQHSSDANNFSTLNDRAVPFVENSPSKTSRESKFSKFNLSQVDQLLMEMEKTRAEIKSKLQSNKNKISEMRRECFNNDINAKPNPDNISTHHETIRNLEFSKRLSDVCKGKEKAELSDNVNNLVKNQLNFDLNFAIPGVSKNMLQLSQIMSPENNAETLLQKLEAEILKKKHCEEIIQELHLKILEQQQNLSVAQKIDAEKDNIIKQLQNAWLQLVEHWKELEHQRQELALMLEQERVEARNLSHNLNQKIETLENRLHETISLASSYRGKNEELEKSLKQMQESVSEFENNFKKTEDYSKLIELEKSNILEQLRQTNESLTSEKQKSLLSESRVIDLGNQISILISEKNDLAASLREEKMTVDNLKEEIFKLKEDYSRVSSAEYTATQQLNSMKQEILRAKNNLKEFYQNQLDILLRKKVEDFQKEFQKAQTIMRHELNDHERLAEERLQSELKQLQDSHKIELSEERRVNQKHVNILKTELRESRKKIHELENRLKSDSSTKAELAKRVQSVLKNQWFEALNVISGNDDLSKDFLSLNVNNKNVSELRHHDNEDESSELEFTSHKSHKIPFDLRNYISMLLEKEPGNPVDDYRNLEFLLSGHGGESSDKKSSDVMKNSENFRKKPPWK